MMPIYEDKFVEALIKYDVPVELKYLPIVESALKPKAYSRMGAAGMWQFIYSTGNKYGLQVNSLVDDRYDIAKASDAAARHRSMTDMTLQSHRMPPHAICVTCTICLATGHWRYRPTTAVRVT